MRAWFNISAGTNLGQPGSTPASFSPVTCREAAVTGTVRLVAMQLLAGSAARSMARLFDIDDPVSAYERIALLKKITSSVIDGALFQTSIWRFSLMKRPIAALPNDDTGEVLSAITAREIKSLINAGVNSERFPPGER